MTRFSTECRVAAPREQLYAWHARPGAFQRLAPTNGSVRLVSDSGGIEDGARKVIALGPCGLRWIAVHDAHVFGRQFRDVQERGPFRRWEHTHSFRDDPPDGSILRDEVEYELPLGRLADLVAGRVVAAQLKAMFARRHEVTRHDVELFAREPAPDEPIEVVNNGRSAQELIAFLGAGGWRVSENAAAAIRIEGDAVHTRGGRLVAPLTSTSDAALAAVHRALRALAQVGRLV